MSDQLGCTAAEALEENRRNGGRGFGILGGLRAPPPSAPRAPDAGTPPAPDGP